MRSFTVSHLIMDAIETLFYTWVQLCGFGQTESRLFPRPPLLFEFRSDCGRWFRESNDRGDEQHKCNSRRTVHELFASSSRFSRIIPTSLSPRPEMLTITTSDFFFLGQ